MSARSLRLIASLLFLLSGATALTYETIWFKRFSHVWGNSSLAMAAVVASFLLGLGLGAWLAGRRADRLRRPLLLYALCELAIGTYAFFVPALLEASQEIAGLTYPVLSGNPAAFSALRLVIAFCVIGPPCAAMGATLPLLVAGFTRPETALVTSTGWLYAINTFGAAVGTYLAGFHLLPSFGLSATNTGAALLNIVIGIVAWRLAPHFEVTPDVAPPPRNRERAPWGLRGAALATGAAALLLQLVWARQLALVLGGTTYAFSAVLLVVLIGIGVGSLIVSRTYRTTLDPVRVLVGIEVLLVVATLAGQHALPWLARVLGAVREERASPLFNGVVCVGASFVLELLPAIAAGAIFPLLIHFASTKRGSGRAVGEVYTWNTIGTTIGALGAYMVLIPRLGTELTVACALVMYLVALFCVVPGEAWRSHKVGTALALALGVLAFVGQPKSNPLDSNAGMYLYGDIPERALAEIKPLSYVEGAVANVLVTEHIGEHVSLRVNGKVDASTTATDMVMNLGIAYLPRLLKPEARDVLMVGWGSGTSPGALIQVPGTKVVCAEIEPAIVAASPYFASVNRSAHESPDVEILFDDGRSHLQGTDRTYDLILTEPSNPWMVGISNLFTIEFYRAAAERLRDNGLVVQWIQTYLMSAQEYELILRTVLEVFPHGVVVRISSGDTIVIAGKHDFMPDTTTLDRAQALVDELPVIAADLSEYFGSSDVRSVLLEHVVMGPDDIETFLASERSSGIHSDRNMRLEFDAPLHLFREQIDETRVADQLLAAVDPAWTRSLFERFGSGAELGPAIARLSEVYRQSGLPRTAWQIARLDPRAEDPTSLALRLLNDPPRAARERARLERVLATADPLRALRIAITRSERGDYRSAADGLEEFVQAHPRSSTGWAHLAMMHSLSGHPTAAGTALQQALALDPLGEGAQRAMRELR